MTSFAAAASVDVPRQMGHVLDALWFASNHNRRPVTDTEIRNAAWTLEFGDSEQGLRSRRSTLKDYGFIRAVDMNGVSPKGRRAIRWQLTDSGEYLYLRMSGVTV
ncbi:MAG: hypothetical protein LKJ05_02665 [Bifidobacteriaceae bacterium]|nr:hypothetical protein [Bifidobacteriaceae bacterium]